MQSKSFTHRSLTVLLTTMLLLVAIPVSAVLAASTNTFNANQTVANNSVTNPNNGWTSNTSYADFNSQSDTVEFGFADLGIPAGSAIDGIEVTVEGYRQSGTRNFTAALWNTSASNPDAYTTIKTATLTTTDTAYTLGNATDKWGTTWTVADFADATFRIRIGTTSSGMGDVSRLDSVAVKVYYKAPQATLTVNNPGTVVYGNTATLGTTGGSGTGAVTFNAGASTGCSVSGNVLSVTNASGICSITATKAADSDYLSATSAVVSITLQKAEATCAIVGFSGAYDATAHGASGSCSGIGGESAGSLDLGNSFTSVPGGTANWAFTGNSNYNDQAASVAIDITKAEATCAIVGFSGAYDATAHGASGSCSGIGGESAGSLDLGNSFTSVPGGTANWAFTGNSNYNDQAASVAIDITKVEATCAIVGFSGAYDATAHGASGSCSGIGGESAGSLDLGNSFTSVPGGTANWAFTGNSNYNDQAASVAIDITKVEATCAIVGFSGAYDATAHGASGSCSGIGGESAGSLDLGNSFTSVPGGTANWAFTGNSNYNDQAASVAIDITKVEATCAIVGFSGAYDATAHGASGSCSGIGGESAGSLDLGNSFTSVPGGTANWAFTGNSNYNDQAASVAIDITKADASCTVTGYSVTYDGAAHTATGSCPGVGLDGPLAGLDLSATTHTAIGAYPGDAWTFTDVSGNYNNDSGTVDNLISAVPDTAAHVDVYIGDNPKESYTIPVGQSIMPQYAGVTEGPVRVVSTNGLPIFTSQRANFNGTFNELMGFPVNQLTTEYWFTYYDNVWMNTNLMIGNADETTAAEVDVYIGDNPKVSYTIPAGESIMPQYPGVTEGPVRVVSTNGVKIFTSQRANFNGTFNELMGFPANQLTTEYWFTYYDNVWMNTNLMIGNADETTAAEVDVYIGDNPKESYTIPAGESIMPQYPGVTEGPVRVVSTNGVKIFTSQRANFNGTFNELMGFPANQLTTEYWFTYYDNVWMNTNLMIGNADETTPAEVDVYIGDNPKVSYTIPAGESIMPQYAGVTEGPVRVVSTNGVKIFTSQRVNFNGTFNELMGLPANQLTTEYWFTYYDNVWMNTNLMIGRP